jgi:hypothetical protein
MNSFELVTEFCAPKSMDDIRTELDKMNEKYSKKLFLFDEVEEEERNDVYIYKTLKYPPKSTPRTID